MSKTIAPPRALTTTIAKFEIQFLTNKYQANSGWYKLNSNADDPANITQARKLQRALRKNYPEAHTRIARITTTTTVEPVK